MMEQWLIPFINSRRMVTAWRYCIVPCIYDRYMPATNMKLQQVTAFSIDASSIKGIEKLNGSSLYLNIISVCKFFLSMETICRSELLFLPQKKLFIPARSMGLV